MRRTDSAMGWRAGLVCPAADLIGEISLLDPGRRETGWVTTRVFDLLSPRAKPLTRWRPSDEMPPGTPCRGVERDASWSLHPPGQAAKLSQGRQAADMSIIPPPPRKCKGMGGGVTWLGINPRNSLSQPLLSTHEAATFGTSAPPGRAFLFCFRLRVRGVRSELSPSARRAAAMGSAPVPDPGGRVSELSDLPAHTDRFFWTETYLAGLPIIYERWEREGEMHTGDTERGPSWTTSPDSFAAISSPYADLDLDDCAFLSEHDDMTLDAV